MRDRGFGGPNVCALVGISYRQLDHWARTGLLEPSLAPATGSGSRRLYSYGDLVELKVIKRLLDGGVSLRAARRAIDFLRQNLAGDLSSVNLVLDGKRSILARSGEEIVDLLAGGQGVLNIVPLGSVLRELDAAIVELDERRPVQAGETADPAGSSEGGTPRLDREA